VQSAAASSVKYRFDLPSNI